MMRNLISLALGAAVATAAPAAAEIGATRTQEVHYGDLNLAKAAGAAALKSRVRAAARAVCGVPQPSVAEHQFVYRCRETALEAARPQVELALERARRGSVEMAGSAHGSISVRTVGSR